MNEKLKNIWLEFEANKEKAIAILKENHNKKVESGWTPLQTIEHILQSEAGTLAYLKKKMQSSPEDLPLVDDESNARSKYLNGRLKSDERYKRPDILPDPAGDKTLEEYLAYWDKIHSKWKDFIENTPDEYFNRQVFKHPLAGRISLEQTVAFMTHHIEHHYRQLRGEK